jgi:hypothetical protein
MKFIHHRIPVDIEPNDPIVAATPFATGQSILVFTRSARVGCLDLREEKPHFIGMYPDHGLDAQMPISLRVSSDQKLCALVNTFGLHGLVVDLDTGKVLMQLEREDYQAWATSFPVAFFDADGIQYLVHGPQWNRLDISDARSGKLLTGRTLSGWEREDNPDHHVDFFHSELSVSPDNRWIVDNGWHWHPAGSLYSWNLQAWLHDNVWESENGPTRRCITWCEDLWDRPLCWIDSTTLAVWGRGNDDEIPFESGIALYDVRDGKEIRWLAGPAGYLAFDGFLFVYTKPLMPSNRGLTKADMLTSRGTSVWDLQRGNQVHNDPNFCPTFYHHGAGCFVTVLENEIVISRFEST